MRTVIGQHRWLVILRTAVVLVVTLAIAVTPGLPVGDPAAAATAEGELIDPGAIPGNLQQTSGSCVVSLTWDAPENPPDELLGYDVYRWEGTPSGDPEWVGSTGPSRREFLDYMVVNGETYVYTVKAVYDDKVTSQSSATVTGTPEVMALRVVLTLDDPNALVNGETVPLDAPGQLVEGSTMVPLRFVASGLGATVQYDAGPRLITVTLGSRVVKLWIGNREAEVDGLKTPLAAPPVVVNGRTMVPLRFISEAFGAMVNYDPTSRTVTVTLTDDDAALDGALELVEGESVEAALNGSNDVDTYFFRTRLGDAYALRTENLAPGCDTLMVVLTPELDVSYYNDDCAYGDYSSEVQLFRFGACAFFYVRIQSAQPLGANPSGNYTITLEKRSDDPFDCPPLVLGAPATGGNMLYATDIDYYAMNLSRGGYYRITTTTSSDPDGDHQTDTALLVYYWDGSGFYAVTADADSATEAGGSAEIVFRAPASGSYYVAVLNQGGAVGSYSVRLQPVEAGDPWASSRDAVTTRPDRDRWREWIAWEGDQDWYEFEAAAGTKYWLQTTDLGPWCDTELTLYGPDGATELARDDDAVGCGYGSRIEWTAERSGTHFVKVEVCGDAPDYWGGYNFCVTTVGPESDDWSDELAQSLTPGGDPVRASLVTGDVDSYTFEAVKGMTYTVATSELDAGLDTYVMLMDDQYTLLASNDDVVEGTDLSSSAQWVATYSGTVRVYVYALWPDDPSIESVGFYNLGVTVRGEGTGL